METFGVGDSRGTGPSQLSSLLEITQCSRDRAEVILEAATGNLERALEIFYAQSEEDREEEESRPAKKTKVNETVTVKEEELGNSHNDHNEFAFHMEKNAHASNKKKLESNHSRSTWRQVPRNNNGQNGSLAAMKNPSVPLFHPGLSLNLNFGLPFPTQNKVFHFGSSSHRQPGPSTALLPLPAGGRPALLPLPVGGRPAQSVQLRPIVIDGSNIAMLHGRHKKFSTRGIEIVIKYFEARGHREITAFVPQSKNKGGEAKALQRLETAERLVFTPSLQLVGGRTVTPYDDRYILDLAVKKGGVVVSRDNYRDLVKEKAAYMEVVSRRLLMPTFVGDDVMMPQDPLGRTGPTLEAFLRF